MRSNTTVSAPFHPGTPWGLFHFEAPEAGAPAPEAAPAPAEPVVEVAPEPTPAAWSGISEDDWLETQRLLREVAGRTQQPARNESSPAGPELALDPFDDNFGQALTGTLADTIGRMLDERLGPIQARQEYEDRQESEQRARDILTDYASSVGTEFDVAIARDLAEPFLQESFERYGVTPRAAEMALHRAADKLIAHNKQIAEKAVNEYKASLERVTGAPTEPSAAGAGVEVTGEADSEYDAVTRALARLTPA